MSLLCFTRTYSAVTSVEVYSAAGSKQGTCKSHVSHKQVTCKSHACHMQVTCKSQQVTCKSHACHSRSHASHMQVTAGHMQVTSRSHASRMQVKHCLWYSLVPNPLPQNIAVAIQRKRAGYENIYYNLHKPKARTQQPRPSWTLMMTFSLHTRKEPMKLQKDSMGKG